ncbi:MAG: DUF2569 family protein [Spirochaetales bacterium]|nr:DUF2569 family protein [Spirochaetales bacterium]
MSLLDNNTIEIKDYSHREGWLVVLIFFLVVLHPFAHLYVIWGRFESLPRVFSQFSTEPLNILLYIGILVIVAGTIILSVVSGILLWKKKRLGVLLTKIFLVISVAVGLTNVPDFLANAQSIEFMTAVQYLIRLGVNAVVVPVAWFLYLLFSKRVKTIYFNNSESNSK